MSPLRREGRKEVKKPVECSGANLSGGGWWAGEGGCGCGRSRGGDERLLTGALNDGGEGWIMVPFAVERGGAGEVRGAGCMVNSELRDCLMLMGLVQFGIWRLVPAFPVLLSLSHRICPELSGLSCYEAIACCRQVYFSF